MTAIFFWVIKWDPFLEGSNKQQMYGEFEGFPEQNRALFGPVIQ